MFSDVFWRIVLVWIGVGIFAGILGLFEFIINKLIEREMRKRELIRKRRKRQELINKSFHEYYDIHKD